MRAAVEMNNSSILLVISSMPWWQRVSSVPQAGTRAGGTKGGAAQLMALGPTPLPQERPQPVMKSLAILT